MGGAAYRLDARTGLDASVYSEEYAKVSAEIELFRDRRQKLKEETAKDSLRTERIKELKVFLMDNDRYSRGLTANCLAG